MKSNFESSPKYIRIARQIQEDISAKYAPGDYLPSVRSLSADFSVTVNTIRMALEILSKLGIVRTLPYRGTVVTAVDNHSVWDGQGWLNPNAYQTIINHPIPTYNKDSKTVALVMPTTPTLMSILARSVERELRHFGYRLQLAGTDSADEYRGDSPRSRQHERFTLESLCNDNLSGVIWWSEYPQQNMDVIDKLQLSGTPVTLIGNTLPNAFCDSLEFDQYTTAARTTKGFLDKENRNVLFWGMMSGATIPSVHAQRLLGFVSALSSKRFSESASDHVFLLPYAPKDVSESEFRSAIPEALNKRIILSDISFNGSFVDEILQSVSLPVSLLVSSDLIAERLMMEFTTRGMSIPDDILIVSFEDACRTSSIHTTVNLIQPDYDIMGERSVQLLMRRIKEPNIRQRQVYLPMQMISIEAGIETALPNIAYVSHE